MNEPAAGARRRVLIVGNYPLDGQESMRRFARMLEDGLRAAGEAAETVVPRAVFGRLKPSPAGLGKWLGYLDKYLLFPWTLRRRVRRLGPVSVVHVADHSNAPYVRAVGSAGHPVVVTCHDLGAVRGALGEDTDCPASPLGKILQRWIVRSLGEADAVPCVSGATRRDVLRLVRREDGAAVNAPVVFNGLNVPYGKIGAEEARSRLAQVRVAGFTPDALFALNIGSALSRKNRAGVLRIFAGAVLRWPEGRLVFAGEALTEAERALARELGVADRVAEVIKPSDTVLEALYNRAICLLFPSKFEGFGWPAIEAQACGCPVLCSDAGALGEVAGDGAFVRSWHDEAAFTAELVRLATDPQARARWIELGDANVASFRTEAMVANYRRLYDEVCDSASTFTAKEEAVR